MKRDQEEYASYNLYEEVQPLTKHYNLTNEELLVAAAIYNLTSKGKRPLEHGLMPKPFKKILKQHKDTFNANPEMRKFERDVYPYLDRLDSLGIIHELSPVIRQRRFGQTVVRTVIRNFVMSDTALRLIKNELNRYTKDNDTKALF